MTLEVLTSGDLVRLVEDSRDGVAVISADGRRAEHVNRVGRLILRDVGSGMSATDLATACLASEDQTEARVEVALGSRWLECRLTWLLDREPPLVVISFRDVTDVRRQDDRLKAFSRSSASLAFAETLTDGLDALAHDVRQTTDMDSCTFLLMGTAGDFRQVGMSGTYPMATDYGDRLEECRRNGAPLLALEAFEKGRPIVSHGWRQRTLADPRFAPLHDISRTMKWDTIVVVPLVVRNKPVGVFNGFYLPGEAPSEPELAFLVAIADQAAVAVDNARLLVELERRASLDERHRLARDLHDSVSQALFSLTLQARAVEVLATEEPPRIDGVRDGLAEIRTLTKGALAEMRALIFQLRPEALHEEGLVASIRRHAAAVASREEADVRVLGPERLVGLSEAAETELFRVVVEAITNAVKHASATEILIEFEQHHDGTTDIAVRDNGTGFDVSSPSPGHLGLTSMMERVTALGGQLTVRSAPGSPTTISAVVPAHPTPNFRTNGEAVVAHG